MAIEVMLLCLYVGERASGVSNKSGAFVPESLIQMMLLLILLELQVEFVSVLGLRYHFLEA